MSKKKTFKDLVSIVEKLRGPKGCPWDREQTHASLKPYLVEEAYEALEAIDHKDYKKLCEELGDVLLQVILHAQLAQEKKKFDIQKVIQTVFDKMILRHPHVFGDKYAKDSKEVLKHWERQKQKEIREKGEKYKGILESIPRSLPALYRADKVQKRAARVGFDWEEVAEAWGKIHEEINELSYELQAPDHKNNFNKIKEELGDLLFAVVNVARKLDINAEEALQDATNKFLSRFKYIEEHAALKNKPLEEMSIAEMDQLWNEAKKKK